MAIMKNIVLKEFINLFINKIIFEMKYGKTINPWSVMIYNKLKNDSEITKAIESEASYNRIYNLIYKKIRNGAIPFEIISRANKEDLRKALDDVTLFFTNPIFAPE